MLRLERAVLEERQLPAVERLTELRVLVCKREAREEIGGEGGAERVEPRRLTGGLRCGDRHHGTNPVRAPVQSLEEHRARRDGRRGGKADRADRVGELSGRVGRLGRARFEGTLELEDAQAVGLTAEVGGQQAVGLGPQLCELSGCRKADPHVGAELDRGTAGRDPDQRRDGAVLVALAEERSLELGVRAFVRAVVPVEAAAHLGRAHQQRQQHAAEERFVLVRSRAGVRAREDRGRRLATELVHRKLRVGSRAGACARATR